MKLSGHETAAVWFQRKYFTKKKLKEWLSSSINRESYQSQVFFTVLLEHSDLFFKNELNMKVQSLLFYTRKKPTKYWDI